MIWGPWIVTASVAEKVDDPAVMKNTCCFNWLELSVMNSSKILNNHITHASICTSTIWRCAPIIRVTIAALQLCTRPHLHRNERKQQTNQSSEEVRQISSQLVFVWPYHCGCGMSKWWTLERRAFSPYGFTDAIKTWNSEHLVLDNGSETKLRKNKTNASTGDLCECRRWQNCFHLIKRYYKNTMTFMMLGFLNACIILPMWIKLIKKNWWINITLYTFVY